MAAPDPKAIFDAALDLPAADRAAFLDHACADHPEAKARVEALLKALGDAGSFLERPADDPTVAHHPTPHGPSPVSTSPLADASGTQIGPYKLRERIGEGGMGVVYLAEQERPVRRTVALKIIKPGMDTAQVVARFEAERQALALMDHPSIAKVLDAGATETGRPYFVMELVKGVPITNYCDTVHLTPKERLELFIPVCGAIQHAHQKGIIHRDIKPSNVLVAMQDGKPVPKVIDFGIAKAIDQKLTERTLFTGHGAIVGTLEYMSPEQAEMSAMDVDTRTDIYALGVLLYELLTGTTPLERAKLRSAAYLEILKRIREEEPPKPSTRLSESRDSLPSVAANRRTEPAKLTKNVRGDLDWIVMKALEKDRTRRYETANGFARDIRRHLDGDPVEASPPSARYKLGKFARKHRAALATAGAFALILLAATAISAWLALWADRERVRAVAAEKSAKEQQTRAQDREQMAIDAVKRFRDAVSDEPELKNTPALEGLRNRLLKEPLNFFRALRDRLQADADTRPESLARLADASFDLGALTAEIGDKQDALIAFQESLAIRRKLAAANPAVTDSQRNVAWNHLNIGNVLAATGKSAAALEAYESALAIYQKLADANPAVTDSQRNLAQTHVNIGLLLRDNGKAAEALAQCESALAISMKLADANPTVIEFQSDLAGIHISIGVLLSDTGKPAEALESYETALPIFQWLADANPIVTDFQRDLARTQNSIGKLLSDTGKPAEALESCEAALAIQRRLADAHPAVTQFQSDLASSYNNIGYMLRDTGKPVEALAAHESALAIREKLAREHPNSPDFASSIGGTLNNLALLDLDANRFVEARARLRQAIEWQRKALAAYPAHPTYRQFLRKHLRNLLIAVQGLDDPEGVAEAERELAKLRDSDPVTAALDARLAAVVSGQPAKDDPERLQLAARAYDKALHAASARLYAEALANDSKLGEDRRTQHRYCAACAAALAASGKGKDSTPPDDAARAKLRGQALDWLKAELSAWGKVALTVGPGNKELVSKTLAHWKSDADLAGLRDADALSKLPEPERAAFQKLWADVEDLL